MMAEEPLLVGFFGSAARFDYQRPKENAIRDRDLIKERLREKHDAIFKGNARRFEKYGDDIDIVFGDLTRQIEKFEFKPYYDESGKRDMTVVDALRSSPRGSTFQVDGSPTRARSSISKMGTLKSQQFSVTGDFTPWNASKVNCGVPKGSHRSDQAGDGADLLRVHLGGHRTDRKTVVERLNHVLPMV